LDGLATNILIGVAMVALLGLSIGLQVVRTRRAPLGKVVSILSSIKYNVKLCENFSYHRSVGRLKSKAWEKNQDKVLFLPQSLRDDLVRLFEIVAEINERIDAAIRYQSDSYMAAIEIDKLKEPLARCQEKLTEWVYENMNNPEYLPKKRGLFRR
jgi:hypothetical protein